MKPSGYYSRPLTKSTFPQCKPEIQWPFRPHACHNTIHSINSNTSNPKQFVDSHGLSKWVLKFPHLGSKIWDRSNGRSRPQTNQTIHKALKQSVKPSRMKPLPHGVCQNSLKLEPTRRPRRVEQPSFLSQRIPTVGSPGNLERSYTLSH